MDFQCETAVITGGAAGIGLSVSQKLRRLGANVVIADVDSQSLELQSQAHDFEGVVCDVSQDKDVAELARVANEVGVVDFVMANAGVAVGGRFEEIPIEEWQRLFEVNLLGVVRTIKAFLPAMIQRKRGRIVVTGSSAGLFASDGFDVPYASSKHGLRSLTEGLAAYCKDLGIDVHYLAPRITDTAFPRLSVAWGRKGARVTKDRSLGDDFDTADEVVAVLFDGIRRGDFLISLTPETPERLSEYVTKSLLGGT